MSRELQIGETKSYIAYKGKDQEPKRTEFGLGYFEDEIGWYFISGELTLPDPYTVDFKYEMGVRVINPLVNAHRK